MWHWGWWNTIYRTWSPQQRKILRKFGSSLSLSNTWRHSSLFLSTSCKLPIKLASLSLLSVSDSVSVSVSVSIEISDSDSDENPLWIFSSCPVELLLAAMFFEHIASKFSIAKLHSMIWETNKTNGTWFMTFSSKIFDKK